VSAEDALSTSNNSARAAATPTTTATSGPTSFGWSDESLKQAISNLQRALQALKQIETKK